MIKIHKIEFQNFLSFSEGSLNFDNINEATLIQGINKKEFIKTNENLFYGSNGSGKTGLVSLIPFVLFNYSEKSNLDEMVNFIEKKNLYIRMLLSKDGEFYTIFKFRKHKNYQNKTFLFKGDIKYNQINEELENQPQKLSSEIQKQIEEEFLGFNQKIFFQTSFFSQNDLANFFNKNTTEKYKIFEYLIKDFEVFNNIKNNLSEILKTKEKELDELNTKFFTIKNLAEEKEKRLTQLTQEIVEEKIKLENDIKIVKEKLQNKPDKNELKEAKNKIKKLEESKILLENNERMYEKLINQTKTQLDNKNYSAEFIEAVKKYEKLIEVKNKLEEERRKEEFEEKKKKIEAEKLLENTKEIENKINKEINNFKIKNEKLKNELEKYATLIKKVESEEAENCPVCGQPLSKSELIALRKKLSELIKEKEVEEERFDKLLNELKIQLENSKKEFDDFVKNINVNENLKNIIDKIEKINNGIEILKKQFDDDITKYNSSYFERLETEKENLKKQIEKYQIEKIEKNNELNKIIEQLSSEAKNITLNYNEIETQINEIEKLEYELKNLENSNLSSQSKFDEVNEEYLKLTKALNIIEEKLKVERAEYENYKFWQIADEIKKDFLNKIIGLFNEKLNILLKYFFNRNIKIIFDEELNYKVYFEDIIIDNNIEILSGGEQRRVNLACNLALFFVLRELANVNFNVLIFDEILDINLDALGVKAVLNIIEMLQKIEDLKILVISHKSDYLDYFNNVITVVKEIDGNSHLE